jgi:hypothetical protein
MWSVLSGDFDPELSRERCADHVLRHMTPGSIVVFHDSLKALHKMQYALPLVLDRIGEQGWVAEKL